MAETIPCVIIDDDPFIRDLLVDKLMQHFPEIRVIGLAKSGKEGLEMLKSFQPKLVFLDVEMNDMTGFELLSQLSEIKFKTIFITSYRHYAIKAIRFNALDYLLKPFDLEELKNAIARFKSQELPLSTADSIHQALINLATPDTQDHILTLNTQEGPLKIALKDILHIQGDRNYSCIYLTNQRKEIVSKTLADLEEILDDRNFFRSHKSHLVNRIHVKSLPNSFSLMLTSGLILPVSRRRRQEFLDWAQDSLRIT